MTDKIKPRKEPSEAQDTCTNSKSGATATSPEPSAREALQEILAQSKEFFNADGTEKDSTPPPPPADTSSKEDPPATIFVADSGKEKKPSFQAIMEGIVDHINGGATGEVIFGKHYPWKTIYHVEVSPEGERQVLVELPGNVLRYVTQTMVMSEIYRFTDRLPRIAYRHYKMDSAKVKKIFEYWLMTKTPLTEKIHPVLQKDTPGYCFHRFDFNMEDRSTEIFDYIMDGLGHNREAVLAFIGSMFDPHQTLQQYCWITGPGGDGKGSLFRVLKRLFDEAYVGITTEKNQLDKYWASSLLGKRLAVCGDTRNLDFINEPIFMQITGGDAVSVRAMRKSAYSAHLPCLFLLGANAYPNIGSGGAAARRAIIANFSRKAEDKVHFENFEARLWDERAGILYKCWAEWKKVRHLQRIPVDMAQLQERASATEEDFQVLFDTYFVLNDRGYCTAMEVKQALDKEKFVVSNVKVAAWKRWLEINYGVTAVRMQLSGVTCRVYKGMSLIGATPSRVPISDREEKEF